MERIAMRNNVGMTLIEMLIAMLISLIVFLALMQSVLMAINRNLQNELRDEAVNVGDMRINAFMSLPFTDTHLTATSGYVADPMLPQNANLVTRTVRNITVNYTSTVKITDLDAYDKQLDVQISWIYRGQSYFHGISTIVRAK